jgi:crotonobetainyl-CoA:carnitine CoA-transferase CaiB-like acyl-CoA transferase
MVLTCEEKREAKPGALAGLKVLDFTTLLPGPYATMCLADMGADVLRIVSASRPDMGDSMPPFLPGTDVSSASAYLGRNKRCMNLNLKDPRAREIVGRIISVLGFDIVIEQFRPGVMSRLKLDYESLKAVDPRLIYCSITGYGQDGPLRDKAGHDINYIARSGIASYSGKKGQGPSLMAMQIADVAAGSQNAIIGILAAAFHRNATGRGQFIDISMTDGMIAFNTFFGAAFFADGKVPEPETTFVNGGSLYDYYETADGAYISFGGLEPQFFANFCRVIDRPDLIRGGVMPKDAASIKTEIRHIIATKTRQEWLRLFHDTDACVEPVLAMDEVFQDALANDRGMLVDVPLSDGRTARQIANPIKFSETGHAYRHIGVPSSSGSHTGEVFKELGYADSEIEAFAKTGLFG